MRIEEEEEKTTKKEGIKLTKKEDGDGRQITRERRVRTKKEKEKEGERWPQIKKLYIFFYKLYYI